MFTSLIPASLQVCSLHLSHTGIRISDPRLLGWWCIKVKEAMNPLGKDLSHITYITDVSIRHFGKFSFWATYIYYAYMFQRISMQLLDA